MNLDDMSSLWRSAESAPPPADLRQRVQAQTRRWQLLIALEALLLVIGIVVPAMQLIEQVDPFRLVWAADIWGVTLIAGWFTLQKVRGLMSATGETTAAYRQLMIRRHEHQIGACRAGLVLAGLQFLVVPALLFLWGNAKSEAALQNVVLSSVVLLLMGGYMAYMARQIKRSRAELLALRGGE
ncbi:MAG: hypothetical protein AAF529_08780 [Pseudomonadota bacterium]